MDGVFMKKLLRRIVFCCVLAVFCWSGFLLADREALNKNLIRFHVVAHSDSLADQSIKIHVRDVVLADIGEDLKRIHDIGEAKRYLQSNIPKIQRLVDQTLQELGFAGGSCVTLCKERFNIRHYDTFSLPSGVYDSLRIVIGDGIGKNWWCVSFPMLCVPATTSGFEEAAVEAGFTENLAYSLTGHENYEIRFFILDQLGKLENYFFQE